jgi:amidase
MIAEARRVQAAWLAEVTAALTRVQLFALPTLCAFAPLLGEPVAFNLVALTSPFNVSGSPALAMPVPVAGSALPGSLQLVGPLGGEELLCATAAVVEEAVGL